MSKIPREVISHVSVGVGDLPRAKAFYSAILAPLGLRLIFDQPYGCAWGTTFPTFWAQLPFDQTPASPGNGVHVCFNAPDKAAVDAFHAAGLTAGGTCDGPPGLRTIYTPNYYAAFLRDPDGNKVEALCLLNDDELAGVT